MAISLTKDLMSSNKIDQKATIKGRVRDFFQIGKIVVQLIDEKVFRRLGLELRVGFALLGILIVGSAFVLYLALRPQLPTRMTGDFRIAVAGFAERGHSGISEIGMELAEGVYLRLEQTFEELDLGFTVTVWGPNQVGTIEGQSYDVRAESAAQIAESIGADVVVYGVVDTTDAVWQVTPEFYVSAENFYEAEEITGQHALGAPLSITGKGGIADRIQVSNEWTSRVQVLSKITVGLAYYSVRDFKQALTTFQSAEGIEVWEESEGKQVLHLLIGNASGKIAALKLRDVVEQKEALRLDEIRECNEDLKVAETYYQKSSALDTEYARAYVGLANVYYMQALSPFVKTMEPADVDFDKMSLSIATYEKALKAAHQPPLSDVSTKVHFGLGQCHFMLVYSENAEFFNTAIAEFEAVIEEYANGDNPRVRELAAESHARLGRIYVLSEHTDWAIEEYQAAASLLYDNPDRQALYKQTARELKENDGETQ